MGRRRSLGYSAIVHVFIAAVVALSIVLPAKVSAAATNLYMATEGNDALDGSTPTNAVQSLSRIKALAAAITTGDIDVQIAPGTYYGQSVNWDNTIYSSQQITFRQWEGMTGWPIFVGDPTSNQPFFNLNSNVATGSPTNLRFWHLAIQYYKDGIVLNGSKEDPALYTGWNEIKDVRFRYIGSLHAGTNPSGYKAIGLTNSRSNIIKYNRFERVENVDQFLCGSAGTAWCRNLIHGIYLAHNSRNNTIKFNYFSNVSGDPVKTRDRSDHNYIWGNIFWKTGEKAVMLQEWYRKSSSEECPSFLNNLRYNLYGKDYDHVDYPPEMVVQHEDTQTWCESERDLDLDGSADPLPTTRVSKANNSYVYWESVTAELDSWHDVDGVITNWRADNNVN